MGDRAGALETGWMMNTIAEVPAAKASADIGADVLIRKRLSANFNLDVSFAVAAGITIVFGPSGSGKTTLLDCIAGLIAPDSGRIAIAGRTIYDGAQGTNIPVQDRNIGYLFQELALFPHLSAEQNIQYGIAHLDRSIRQSRITA